MDNHMRRSVVKKWGNTKEFRSAWRVVALDDDDDDDGFGGTDELQV